MEKHTTITLNKHNKTITIETVEMVSCSLTDLEKEVFEKLIEKVERDKLLMKMNSQVSHDDFIQICDLYTELCDIYNKLFW